MHFEGWGRYEELLRRLSIRYNIPITHKYKNGYISISVPTHAPSKLLHLIDLIEHASDNSVQFCGREKALEKITDTNWIIKTCSECES